MKRVRWILKIQSGKEMDEGSTCSKSVIEFSLLERIILSLSDIDGSSRISWQNIGISNCLCIRRFTVDGSIKVSFEKLTKNFTRIICISMKMIKIWCSLEQHPAIHSKIPLFRNNVQGHLRNVSIVPTLCISYNRNQLSTA